MSDWIKWNGGECPVAYDTKVLVRLRDGTDQPVSVRAGNYLWGHGNEDGDIVAYKVAGPEKPVGTNPKDALATQVGGAHYKGLAIQPIEYIHANKLGYCEANVVKYISRWREKGGKQDLEKVKHYVDLLIQLEGL